MIKERIKQQAELMEPLVGHDRLHYLIDIAREVEPLTEQEKIDENKIRGCASNLWLVGQCIDGLMYYKHDADAFITKGTAKLLVDLVNGARQSDVAELTLESFNGLGIKELLTMQRQIGFSSLIEKIIAIAKLNK
jgi:cysteine desulfuration protein SufE